jgi:hypothetical protein
MDVAVNHDGKLTTAMTVRQFAPSRIEKQLLAQVFELLMTPRSSADSMGHDGVGTPCHDQAYAPRPVVATSTPETLTRRATL